jgi:hypothetical protein
MKVGEVVIAGLSGCGVKWTRSNNGVGDSHEGGLRLAGAGVRADRRGLSDRWARCEGIRESRRHVGMNIACRRCYAFMTFSVTWIATFCCGHRGGNVSTSLENFTNL